MGLSRGDILCLATWAIFAPPCAEDHDVEHYKNIRKKKVFHSANQAYFFWLSPLKWNK